MQWLVRDAQPNDSLWFHYSGHGGQTKVSLSVNVAICRLNLCQDLDGDEDDGYDETIYPVDHETAGMIVDDEMHDIMVRLLPIGCRLTVSHPISIISDINMITGHFRCRLHFLCRRSVTLTLYSLATLVLHSICPIFIRRKVRNLFASF